VYQPLGAVPSTSSKNARSPATPEALQAQLQEARERLKFVQQEAPTNLFSEQEKALRAATIEVETTELAKKLAT
jgi:hypothetical protein